MTFRSTSCCKFFRYPELEIVGVIFGEGVHTQARTHAHTHTNTHTHIHKHTQTTALIVRMVKEYLNIHQIIYRLD